jgi:monoamine oxidase
MPGHLYRTLRRRSNLHVARNGLSRRDMLRRSLAAAAGLLLSAGSGVRAAQAARPRVLIVGAGFAGLSAAYELQAAGYEVHVFEARDRIGGRVLSFHDLVPGVAIEGGAELVGSNHPLWMTYADRFNLTLDRIPDDGGAEPLVLGGRRVPAATADRLWEEIEGAYAQLNRAARDVNADEPWLSPDAAALDAASVAEWIDGIGLSAMARTALHAEFAADNGVDTGWQSQLGNLAQIKGGGLDAYWTDSEVFRCHRGNQQLADHLAGALAPGALRVRTPVRAVAARPDRPHVALADGTVVEGDDVILAVPPSVWPRIRFDPPLPSTLVPQMGVNVKYLSLVRSRFWRRAGLSPDSLADGPVQLTWDATSSGRPGDGPAVLTSFSGGESARRCRDWPGAARANQYLRTLEAAYPDIAREFVKGRFMDWPADPWAQASYSFPAPGQVTRMGPVLREGIGRLHFAGEHTNYAFVGYMEGALGSGATLARRLAVRDRLIREDAA